MSHSPGKYPQCVPRDFCTLNVCGKYQKVLPSLCGICIIWVICPGVPGQRRELSLCVQSIRMVSCNSGLWRRLFLAGLIQESHRLAVLADCLSFGLFSTWKSVSLCVFFWTLDLWDRVLCLQLLNTGNWACSRFTWALFCSPAFAAGISNLPVWFLSWKEPQCLSAKRGRGRYGLSKVTKGWLGLGPGRTLSFVWPVPRFSLNPAFTRRIQTTACRLGKLNSPWTKTTYALGSFLRALLS